MTTEQGTIQSNRTDTRLNELAESLFRRPSAGVELTPSNHTEHELCGFLVEPTHGERAHQQLVRRYLAVVVRQFHKHSRPSRTGFGGRDMNNHRTLVGLENKIPRPEKIGDFPSTEKAPDCHKQLGCLGKLRWVRQIHSLDNLQRDGRAQSMGSTHQVWSPLR